MKYQLTLKRVRQASRVLSAIAAAVVLIGAAALASPAAAADFYASTDGGSDASACTSTAAPCLTIAGALSRATSSPGSGDTVWVDDGAYNESVDLGDGNSLRALDFDPADGSNGASITSATGSPAIRVLSGDPAGTIAGFTLRGSGDWVVELRGTATVTGNTLDSIVDGSPGILVGDTTLAEVTGNVLDAASDNAVGIFVAGVSTVSGNELRHLSDAIVAGGEAYGTISGNTITGLTRSSGPAHGIQVEEPAGPTLVANVIRDPDPASTTVGINVFSAGFTDDQADATLERNRILGEDIGVRLVDTYPISMQGDLIADSSLVGLTAGDFGTGPTDVSATNLTLDGNGTDLQLHDNQLTLDSSIVGLPIHDVSTGSGATCTITYSRGPTTTAGGNGCQGFQTSADPAFVDEAGGDYHLSPGSPMIDAGNPTPPPPVCSPPFVCPGSMDLDGRPRAIDGDGDGSAVRDIGAYEFVPTTPPGGSAGGGTGGGGPSGGAATPPPGPTAQQNSACAAALAALRNAKLAVRRAKRHGRAPSRGLKKRLRRAKRAVRQACR